MKKTAEDIAREKQAEIDKKKAEARGADQDPSKSEKEKTKGEQEAKAQKEKEAKLAREKAEAQAKEDRRILETPDDKLNDDERKRKIQLKEKSKQEKINARIGELTADVKKLKESGKAKNGEIEKLNKQIAELSKVKTPDKEILAKQEAEELKKAEKERIERYIEEDKNKPREERREMTKEELEDWFGEDMIAAQEWISQRTLRRDRERSQYKNHKIISKKVKDILSKQNEYARKVYEKHPELNTEAREKELEAQGKSKEEIRKILLEENEKVRLCTEIASEHPEWLLEENGPELIVNEMEKRLKPTKTEDEKTVDSLKQEIADLKAEIERRDKADEAGGEGSSRAGEEETPKTDFQKKQEDLAKKAGISLERLKKAKERRKTIPGASYYGTENE